MADADPERGRLWESGWRGHAEAQRARLASLPLVEKLRWLEEAQTVLAHLRQGSRTARERDQPPPEMAGG